MTYCGSTPSSLLRRLNDITSERSQQDVLVYYELSIFTFIKLIKALLHRLRVTPLIILFICEKALTLKFCVSSGITRDLLPIKHMGRKIHKNPKKTIDLTTVA